MLAYCIDSASDGITCIPKQGPTYLDVNASTDQPDFRQVVRLRCTRHCVRSSSDGIKLGQEKLLGLMHIKSA